jgi:hypothetical protein
MQFNSPVDVNWNAMENTLLKRFWAKHRAQRRRAAPISDRILLFHRGIYTVIPVPPCACADDNAFVVHEGDMGFFFPSASVTLPCKK